MDIRDAIERLQALKANGFDMNLENEDYEALDIAIRNLEKEEMK